VSVGDGFPDQLGHIDDQIGFSLTWIAWSTDLPGADADHVVQPTIRLAVGVNIEDPLRVVLGFLQVSGRFDVSDPSRTASFGEPDLRLANRGGARISAAQIAAILQRRGAIERALRDIPSGASLSAAVNSVPWLPLRQLFDTFAGIRGIGLSKMTKALYPKRPPFADGRLDAAERRRIASSGAVFLRRHFLHQRHDRPEVRSCRPGTDRRSRDVSAPPGRPSAR
jgi:hypothetical protein